VEKVANLLVEHSHYSHKLLLFIAFQASHSYKNYSLLHEEKNPNQKPYMYNKSGGSRNSFALKLFVFAFRSYVVEKEKEKENSCLLPL